MSKVGVIIKSLGSSDYFDTKVMNFGGKIFGGKIRFFEKL